MGIQEQAQQTAQQRQGMIIDPAWSSAEREKYVAAYHTARRKLEEKDRQEKEKQKH